MHLSHAWMDASGLLPGHTIHVQYLYSDPGATWQLGHSAALRFMLCP